MIVLIITVVISSSCHDLKDTMNLENLVQRLIQTDVEEPCIEFKGNKNDSEMIAKDISALSNSTIAHDKPVAFMVWGVDDIGHDIVGTTFNPNKQKVGNEDLINWLHQNITNNVDYHFEETSVFDKRVVVLTVNRPVHSPVRFRNVAYIRDGSHTKPLDKLPLLERKFWENMNRSDYEVSIAKPDLSESEALSLLDMDCIMSRLGLQRPTDSRRAMEILIENGFVTMQPDGGFGITVLGAILFAKDLHDFKPLLNKTVRIVQYEGSEKTTIARQYECEKGYAVQFDRIIETVSMLIPAVQRILPDGQMAQFYGYPLEAIREVVANAMIHQDLAEPMHVTIEIFKGHMTVTNAGRMLIDPNRVLDSPPRSRNTHLPDLFRRMRLCEQLGSGWDRIVSLCEDQNLPTPRIREYETATVVSMHEKIPFEEMQMSDKLWACYMHACRMHLNGKVMTNQSLRSRFDLTGKNATVTVSRLIKSARDKDLIKVADDTTGPKNQGYIPYWA